MIILLSMVAWYAFGLFISWRTLLAVDPIITRTDVVFIAMVGIFGPANLIYFVAYALPESAWWNKPVRSLSKRR
jgi:hypothetical protein